MRTIFYNAKDNIHWRLPSREYLFHRLGEYDTMAEFTVLSECHFEHLCESADSYVDFVNDKAKEYGVNIRCGVTLENYREAMYKSFMINTHAIFNEYFRLLKNDLKIYFLPEFKVVNNNQISTFQRYLNSLQGYGFKPNIPLWLQSTIEYYRLVRNYTAHIGDDNKECVDAYNRIDKEQIDHDYPVFSGKAPNAPNSITMEDFYMFSACVKHVANMITISLMGQEKWTDLGKNHPSLRKGKIPKGTDKRKFVQKILNDVGHKCVKEEVDMILNDIRNQY